MARIRTIKPEAFISESLAAVSVLAERTFVGLLTQADDHGRFRDQAAVIAGALWSLRPEHGPLEVEDDLTQLEAAGLICRYGGEDGKRYLHIVTWSKHQKINRPSGSRHPACPHHQGRRPTGPSAPVRGGVREGSGGRRESSVSHDFAGQGGFREPSPQAPEDVVKPHGPDLGPRTMDLGSTPSGGASAPAPDTTSAQHLIAEYVTACPHRPPNDFLGHLGREVNKLVGEGIDVDHLRAGLALHRAKGAHPSVLPSMVHEAMNATSTPHREPRGTAPTLARHTAWTNPTDPAAYAEEL
ncbi:hypothetical protein [Streptomyces cavernicola]|uniref:Phage or prophage related protein n=1 Tax=Streptomyces cavernicola TaxID=3043613 RepID=A0ABT6S4M2_9ACTN|nr:hypothetical protein [Streptomyces sp. B-S-A6]MDI3402849.1 hypothetical protein [Streptomyces sp. B-S-A6]